MTTIKATCPHCGEVTLTPGDIELRVDPYGVERSSYAFTCPDCGEVVRKPADDRVVRLLVSGGVESVAYANAATVGAHANDPRLTHDDLLDFHTLLHSDDWFDQLLAASADTR